MLNISIRLPDQLLQEVDVRAHELHIQRAEYVRKALEAMNAEVLKQQHRSRLIEVSRRVRKESMIVNPQRSSKFHRVWPFKFHRPILT